MKKGQEDLRSKLVNGGLLTVVLLLTAAARIHLAPVPLERDEGAYATLGQLLLQGLRPYEDFTLMTLPGIFAAYALILSFFGQTHVGIHLGLLVINAVTIVLLYRLGKVLRDSTTGLATAACFALLSLSHSVQGIFAHPEHFVMVTSIGGLVLLASFILGRPRLASLFVSGLALGISVLMKQHGLIFIALAGVLLLNHQLSDRPVDWKRLLIQWATFCGGFLIPIGLNCIILLGLGVFHQFWFWTFVVAREYAASIPLKYGLVNLQSQLSDVVASSPALWILAGVGFVALLLTEKDGRRRTFVLGFVLFSFLAVCPGFYFRPHYFLFLMPAAALLTGIAVSSVGSLRVGGKAVRIGIQTLLFLIPLLHTVALNRTYLFQLSPTEISRMIYLGNPFAESLEIAKYIKEHTSKEDRIAVIGSEPQIYFYSQRRSASRYIHTYQLMEKHKDSLKMQQEMIREIESARPKYVVFVAIPMSWTRLRGSETLIFQWFGEFQNRYYQREGFVEIFAAQPQPKADAPLAQNRPTVYLWGDRSIGYMPSSHYWIEIFRRKE